MTRLFTLFVLITGYLAPVAAQGRYTPLEKWDHTAFVSYTQLHPMQIVTADNNWELLWQLQVAQTRTELQANNVVCTQSQLILLRDAGMIVRLLDGRWKTTLPLLDSLQTTALREDAGQTAENIIQEIGSELRAFTALLDRQGFRKNAFVLLFSHVLDGTIWDEFDRRKITSTPPEHPGWEGFLWFCYPRHNGFQPGTNTWPIDKHHTLNACWSDSDPAFARRIADNEVLKALGQAIRHDVSDTTTTAQQLGLLDTANRLSIPVIQHKGMLGRAIRQLTRNLCSSFVKHTDIEQVEKRIGTEDRSLAVMVFYHEVMWKLNRQLLEEGAVVLPKIFADPSHATPADLAAICFITQN